jgi:hypothetical protein
MRSVLRSLAILFAFLAGGEAGAMIPAPALPADRALPWSYQAQPRPLRYRSGDLLITIAARPAPEGEGWIVPQVTVSRTRPTMQGPQPAIRVWTFRSFPASPAYEHGLGVGRLDAAGHRFVMWQAYTGDYDRQGDAHRDGPFPRRLRAFLVAHGYLPA